MRCSNSTLGSIFIKVVRFWEDQVSSPLFNLNYWTLTNPLWLPAMGVRSGNSREAENHFVLLFWQTWQMKIAQTSKTTSIRLSFTDLWDNWSSSWIDTSVFGARRWRIWEYQSSLAGTPPSVLSESFYSSRRLALPNPPHLLIYLGAPDYLLFSMYLWQNAAPARIMVCSIMAFHFGFSSEHCLLLLVSQNTILPHGYCTGVESMCLVDTKRDEKDNCRTNWNGRVGLTYCIFQVISE